MSSLCTDTGMGYSSGKLPFQSLKIVYLCDVVGNGRERGNVLQTDQDGVPCGHVPNHHIIDGIGRRNFFGLRIQDRAGCRSQCPAYWITLQSVAATQPAGLAKVNSRKLHCGKHLHPRHQGKRQTSEGLVRFGDLKWARPRLPCCQWRRWKWKRIGGSPAAESSCSRHREPTKPQRTKGSDWSFSSYPLFRTIVPRNVAATSIPFWSERGDIGDARSGNKRN